MEVYHPDTTPLQRQIQDSINKKLSEKNWAFPVGKALVNRVIEQEFGTPRHGQRWEILSHVTEIPVIRILPYNV